MENRHVSLRLWYVLERVGVSERIRQLHRETSMRTEILETIVDTMGGKNISAYRFGSSSEGTTTPSMGSDHDVVLCDERYHVIDDIQQATAGECYFIIADGDTKPGYVKLQVVQDGIPLSIHNCDMPDYSVDKYDCAGRICKKPGSILGQRGVNERSGPADTVSSIPGYIPMDFVAAYRSRTFPNAARESLLKGVQCGWLTEDDVNKMVQLGCMLVGVGHPSSVEKDIEWRVSFSLQERYLMFSLNDTQHKCYVLLKLIKIMLTSKPNVEKSITSYHCKTCLFRVITQTKPDQWVSSNLVDCTLMCLTELRRCLYKGNCPNFFLKTNNMFEHRVHGQVKEHLIHYLSEILSERVRVFYHIQSDYIGDALMGHFDRYNVITGYLGAYVYRIYKNMCHVLLYNQEAICSYMNTRSNKDATLYIFQQLCYLASVDTITEHTQEETKDAITYLEPVLHKLYAQTLASLAFSTEVNRSQHFLLQASANHIRQGMIWDLMSGRHIYATILYRQGNLEMCCDLLERIDHTLTEETTSLCGCHVFLHFVNIHLLKKIQCENNDLRSIMKSHLTTCTIFLPVHSDIIPTALQYELYRSVGTPPGSRGPFLDDWYCYSVVDSKVYLYFMQYLIYSNQNNHRDKQIATEKLWTVLQNDRNLGHRETGYNLLGWIYSQAGHLQAAVYCFMQSWTIQPHHNAAKWHMLILIFQQFVARQ